MFALLDDWMDQEQMSKTWHEITGDSFIVDIRKVKKKKILVIQRLQLKYVNML